LQRRRQSEQQAREGGERQRENQQPNVQGGRNPPAGGVRWQDAQQRAGGPHRHQQAEQTAGQRDDQALGQKLPHERPPSGSQSQPDGHFTAARGGARQQQVGHIGAGDQQHQSHQGHQRNQRLLPLLPQLVDALRSRLQFELLAHDKLFGALAALVVFLDLGFHQRPVDGFDGGLRLFRRNSRFQAPQDIQPVSVAIRKTVPRGCNLALHGDGHEQFGILSREHPAESGGRDPDHDHGMTVEGHLDIQDARLAGEAPHPVIVAQHDHGMRAGSAVVLRRERAADGGGNAQHFEKIAGDDFGAGAFRLTVPGDADRLAGAGDNAAETRATVAQVSIQRIGEDALVIVRRSQARTVVVHVEDDQAAGIAHRQRAVQYLVEERKDGCIRADAERQRQHGDGGKQWTARQGTECKTEIVSHV
jgi:hypothetical protein